MKKAGNNKAKNGANTPEIKKTSLFFQNPKTGLAVCYQRAHQIGLLKKKKVLVGGKDRKTGMLVPMKEALKRHLFPKAAFLKAA